jgi:hypothetical protein
VRRRLSVVEALELEDAAAGNDVDRTAPASDCRPVDQALETAPAGADVECAVLRYEQGWPLLFVAGAPGGEFVVDQPADQVPPVRRQQTGELAVLDPTAGDECGELRG